MKKESYGFKVGETIEIVKMVGEPEYDGRRGTISHIDDAGHLHGTWGSLSVMPDVDYIIKIEEERKDV